MENLFNNIQYNKELNSCKLSGADESCFDSQLSVNSNLLMPDTENIENYRLCGTRDMTDEVSILGKNTDVLGFISDESISEVITSNFSKTIEDIMKKIIWAYKRAIKKDPNIEPKPHNNGDANPDWVENAGEGTVLSVGDTWDTQFNSEPKTLILNNPFTGSKYEYQISSTTGSSVNGSFEYLANGRLIVKGNDLKIVAKSGQNDDLIILGNYNDIVTGDKDDTVRVGLVIDNNYEDYYLDSYIDGCHNYSLSDSSLNFYTSVGNKVDTGMGNDYVTMFGDEYTVDMGEGNEDTFLSLQQSVETQNISNVERLATQYEIENPDCSDNLDGWVRQGGDGDCRLLSLINSFCGNNNSGDVKDILDIDITRSDDNVTVIFNKYDTSKFGGINSITFPISELEYFEGAYGDIDTIFIDIALNKLIATNSEYEAYTAQFINDDPDYKDYTFDTCVEDATYNTLARYLTGCSDITYLSNGNDWTEYENDYLTYSKLINCWHKYQSGEISNMSIGIDIDDNDYSLGIIGGHAYSLKNINEEQNYIELLNPWDDEDVLRLPLDKIFNSGNHYTIDLIIYGSDLYNQRMIRPNGGWSVPMDTGNNSNIVKPVNRKSIQKKTMISLNKYLTGFCDTETKDFLKEIQSVEDNINKAKAIFASKKKFGEMIS